MHRIHNLSSLSPGWRRSSPIRAGRLRQAGQRVRYAGRGPDRLVHWLKQGRGRNQGKHQAVVVWADNMLGFGCLVILKVCR
jgi:hypothetical protein